MSHSRPKPRRVPPRPTTGPYAVVGWDRRNHRWVQALTAAGHEFVAEFLAAYDDRPAKILVAAYPQTARMAFRDFPEDEVDHACRVGVYYAAAAYQPHLCQFSTYATHYIRGTVQKWLYPDWKRKRSRVQHLRIDWVHEDGEQFQGWLATFDPEPREDVSQHLAKLDQRRRQVVAMFYGLDGYNEHTTQEIADVIGVSRTRIKNNLEEARNWLRTGRGVVKLGPKVTHCTHCKSPVGERSRGRGLCRSCHRDEDIRRQYTPYSTSGTLERVGEAKTTAAS